MHGILYSDAINSGIWSWLSMRQLPVWWALR